MWTIIAYEFGVRISGPLALFCIHHRNLMNDFSQWLYNVYRGDSIMISIEHYCVSFDHTDIIIIFKDIFGYILYSRKLGRFGQNFAGQEGVAQ